MSDISVHQRKPPITDISRIFRIPLRKILLLYAMTYLEKYKNFYEKNADFYRRRPILKGAVLLLDKYLPLLFGVVYACLCVYSALHLQVDFRRYFFSAGLPFFAFVCTTITRKVVNRPRPYNSGGASIIPLRVRTEKTGESFPSRHATSAFVIASVILSLSVPLGVTLLVAATLINYTRFIAGHHYPSDLIVGSLIGIIFGSLIFFI